MHLLEACLLQRTDLLRTINRIQNRNRPVNPEFLSDLVIQAPYTTLLNGQAFLQHDSGTDDPERFIIFYVPRALEILCNSRIFFGDGTFKTVPSYHTESF